MRWVVLLGVVALAGAGCSSSDELETVASLSEDEQAVLPAISGSELLSLLAAQRGKVVVLAAWSAADPACAAMYPKLAELAALAPPGAKVEVTVIAVNADELSDARSKALPLVRQQDPTVVNHAIVGGPMVLMGALDPDWHMDMPALWLYGKDGVRLERVTGAGALEKAAASLRKLVR